MANLKNHFPLCISLPFSALSYLWKEALWLQEDSGLIFSLDPHLWRGGLLWEHFHPGESSQGKIMSKQRES